jgi:4-amino-4-deoxy-L-arabinose transferase-like glycosyltransferase
MKVVRERVLIGILLFLSFTAFFSRAYETGISGDSAKYALIAKNMVESGNYLVPRLDEPYFKKPPLFFWLIAACMKVFGVSEFALRFPSAIFGVADAVLVYFVSKFATGKRLVGFLSSLIFVFNFEVLRITTIPRMESFMLFVNLMSLLLVFNPSPFRTLLCALLVGAGSLAKGPFAFMGVLAVLLWGVLKRNSKVVINAVLVILAGILTFSAYVVLVSKVHPEFVREFFHNQILGRLTGSLNEGEPRSFFFYERIILKHFWPYNLALIPGLVLLIRKRLGIPRKDWFFLVFVFFALFFVPLHFVSEKFTRYSYYFYPFLSLLTAYFVVKQRVLFRRFVPVILTIPPIFLAVSVMCPCSFHKDKIKDARELAKVGIQTYKNVGIHESIDRLSRYALEFYFSFSKTSNILIGRGERCKRDGVLMKNGNYCIFKE